MANKRIPATVENAIQHAKEAGWAVSIRNEKVIVTAPDGVNLTVGLHPNEPSLDKFRSEARKYNLIDGPARTPAQQEQMIKEAEEAGLRQAEALNAKRKAEAEAAAKKRAAAQEAAKKAAAATANGLKAKPSVPGDELFPAFDESMIGTLDYQGLKLSNGRFYCPECLGQGEKFSAKAPQGLATHRAFSHGMYMAAQTAVAAPSAPKVVLPEDIQVAVELLRTSIAEHLTNDSGDSEKVAELEGKLKKLSEQHDLELKQADKQYNDAKETFDKALRVEKDKVNQLTKELNDKNGVHSAEVEALTKSVRTVLTQIREAVNGLAPAQAIGKIDEILTDYLGS